MSAQSIGRLLLAQVRSDRRRLLLIGAVDLGAALWLALGSATVERLIHVGTAFLFLPFVGIGIALWAEDARARRNLQWLPLPVSPREMITARLGFFTVLATLPFAPLAVAWVLRGAFRGDLDLAEALGPALRCHGLVLAALAFLLFLEEINARLWKRPVARNLCNVLGVVGILASMVWVLPKSGGLVTALAYLLAAAQSLATIALFTTRTDFSVDPGDMVGGTPRSTR